MKRVNFSWNTLCRYDIIQSLIYIKFRKMAVIVHQNENVDSALKRLHREVMREKILETLRLKQYRTKRAEASIEKRREWAKMKRRRRTASRREGK